MTRPAQHLLRVPLSKLRPTQLTVGMAEVRLKRERWAGLKPKARRNLLESHWFPAVRGPGDLHFIVDHHHLGRALHEEAVERVWVLQLADLSELAGDTFWRVMEFHRWAHPFDERGRRRDCDRIPEKLSALRDDPYRSLAGFVREAGGFAKDTEPFTEFLWADFFRARIPVKSLVGVGEPMAAAALARAVELARDQVARYLPGWHGAQ
ncbi:MAG: chromosome partitioning protein ParB [Paucibacter sp.]|nr:chromosome partitioning protein ParB [Roseateles sp.]